MSAEKEKITQVIAEIDNVVDLFYQQKLKEALDRLNVVLGDIMQAMETLFRYREEHEDFAFDEARLKNTLTEAMNALQEQDLVLLADIMQYDFKEYLDEIAGRME